MPDIKWEDIETLHHQVVRMRTYQTDTILRMKITIDTLKEIEETLEKIILETKEDK